MAKKFLRTLTFVLGAVVICLAGVRIGLRMKSKRDVDAVSSERRLGSVKDFSLTERSGKPMTLTDLKGKLWVADFVFTDCMGPCPIISGKMAELSRSFAKRSDLKFVSFSVDPWHDTPKKLSEYAERFGAEKDRWYFLTGNPEKIYALVRESFHLPVEKNGAPKDILHSTSFVLVDKSGEIVGYYNGQDEGELSKLKEKIGTL